MASVAGDKLGWISRSVNERSAYLLTEFAQDVLGMEIDKRLAQDDRHLVDRVGVRPVRVVYRGKRKLVL